MKGLILVKCNKESNIKMKELHALLNKLIKEGKIQFSFRNSWLPLDLLNLCYNKSKNVIEVEFRDVMGEHISELRAIMNNKESHC